MKTAAINTVEAVLADSLDSIDQQNTHGYWRPLAVAILARLEELEPVIGHWYPFELPEIGAVYASPDELAVALETWDPRHA